MKSEPDTVDTPTGRELERVYLANYCLSICPHRHLRAIHRTAAVTNAEVLDLQQIIDRVCTTRNHRSTSWMLGCEIRIQQREVDIGVELCPSPDVQRGHIFGLIAISWPPPLEIEDAATAAKSSISTVG